MTRLQFARCIAWIGGAIACSAPAMAGSITVAPTIQNSVDVQNAQQVQLGYGVDRQEAVLIQGQNQTQVRKGGGRTPSQPQNPRSRDYVPIDDDIVVAPNVQNAVSIQNAQQVQLALPNVRPTRR